MRLQPIDPTIPFAPARAASQAVRQIGGQVIAVWDIEKRLRKRPPQMRSEEMFLGKGVDRFAVASVNEKHTVF